MAMVADNPSANQLVLFTNSAAGSGEADKVLELWRQTVPADRAGPVFRVTDSATYDQELNKALAHCEQTGAALVVAGGDGTVNGVLTRPAGKHVTLGIIPTGTFNYFARSHGVPEEPTKAIQFLLTARPVRVPIAYVNDRPFIVSVSIGLHPTVIAERNVHTRYIGRNRVSAWISGIWTIVRARHITRLTLKYHGKRRKISTPLLMVNFNSAQLFGLDRRFEYKPDRLALLRLRPASYWGLLGLIVRGLSGHILDQGNLEFEYVERLTIQPHRKRERVALDGELVELESPMVFEVRKNDITCLLEGEAG